MNGDGFDEDARALDLERIAADTPAAEGQVFLNSAGSSLPPESVIDRMVRHLRLEAEVGGYTAEAMVAEELTLTRTRVAELFGDTRPGAASRIALGTSAGFASTQFVCGLGLGPGDTVLVPETEFAANALATAYLKQRFGVRVVRIPVGPDGQINPEVWAGALAQGRVRLACLVTVPSDNGGVTDVAGTARLAREAGALVMVDTTQQVGQLPVDVFALGADAAVMNGRKWLRGPRGTGALWLRDGLAEHITNVLPDQHAASLAAGVYAQAPTSSRFEYAEASIAARLGLGEAARYLLALGVDAACAATQRRGQYLREGLARIAGVQVHDREAANHPASAIISFTVAGRSPSETAEALWARRVRVGVVHANASPLDESLARREAVVRASPHYFVTREHLDRALDAVADIAAAAR
ncbi:aminotransferase class V-fold PLP-dependent enzyme [Micrococcales bacterium 31B]|nr:aminotransferase class V-fold PLP-dependent enzyme [Micrococcales bacterium 31B]